MTTSQRVPTRLSAAGQANPFPSVRPVEVTSVQPADPIAAPARPPRYYRATKRSIDLILGSLILLIVAVPLALLMIAIRLDSRGPAIYRQRRVGAGGREFTCYKLRTMVRQNDASDHRDYLRYLIAHGDSVVATRMPDPRITRLGRMLRRASVDELPQLLNIIGGSMSFVGPRPPIPYEVECYNAWQLQRLAVKPGLTGLWQITGRNAVTFNDMCRMDLEYIRRRGVLYDLKILLLTPLRALRGAG